MGAAVFVSIPRTVDRHPTYLVVDALVEEYAKRPPVHLARVALALVDFGCEVGQGARLAGQRLVRGEVGGDVLLLLARAAGVAGATYKICEMDVALGVEQHVVGLDVAVHDALLVDVAHRAAELGDPEAHGLLGEGLARDVEAQVAAVHQIDHDVAAQVSRGDRLQGGPRTGTRCPGSCSADCTGTGG
jgi:hypothetical protein